MRFVYLAFAFTVLLVLGWAGFRGTTFSRPPIEVFPDMDRQPKFKPQAPSSFFADGSADRLPPPGTVVRSMSRETLASGPSVWRGDKTQLLQGKSASGAWVKGFPLPVTDALMRRGQQRYTIYCAPCHGTLGEGNGPVTAFGWTVPANLHQERIVAQAEGEIFNTITHGKNTMYPYADKLTPEDRWAVILYVRALQRSQNALAGDVPATQRQQLGL